MKIRILIPVILFFATSIFAQETRLLQRSNYSLFQDGKAEFEEGLYLVAKKTLETFIWNAPHTPQTTPEIQEAELMIAKAAIYTEQADGEKRMLDFVRKYSPAPAAQKAILELAHYYFDKKMFTQAIRYFEIADLEALDTEQKASSLFKLGYAYFTKKQYAQATEKFKAIESYKAGSHYADANYYLGVIAFQNDDLDTAATYFKNVSQSKKYAQEIPYYLCQIYFANQDYDAVIQEGRNTLPASSVKHELDIQHLVGKSFFEQENYTAALPYFNYYSENTESLRAQDIYQIAFTKYKVGQYDAAIEDFEELKSSDSKMAQNALYNLGDSYLKQGDKMAARNAFASASRMNYDPEIQKDALYLYGKLSYDLGFDREAISVFKNVPTSAPEYSESQRMMSRIFLNTNDYDKAIELMQQIPNKDENIKEAYQKVTYLKGVQLFNDGKLNDAITYLNMSLQSPTNVMTQAMALFKLGEIAHKKKEYAQSSSHLSQFVKIAKGYEGLPEETSQDLAYYILGYNAFKQKDYSSSGIYFETFINSWIQKWDNVSNLDIKQRVFPDAVLRAGDSYYIQKNYDKAITYYQTSINYKYTGYDYALFQKATILGVQGHSADEIASLNQLVKDFPRSTYADDALFRMGSIYYRERNYAKAKTIVHKLINEHRVTSDLINKAYILLGLIHYNDDKLDMALQSYESVFANNPSKKEYATALKSIEEIYINKNDPNGFISFQERVLGKKISDEDKEALTYRAAELQYENSNIQGSIDAYTRYIKRYPKGRFILQAYYNRAESYLAKPKFAQAINDYDYVIQQGNSSLYERALTKAAPITYKEIKDLNKAHEYYAALAKVASSDDIRVEANLWALKSAYSTENRQGVNEVGDALIQAPKATSAQKSLAHFYKAKLAIAEKDYNNALVHFRESAKTNNENGAESRYHLARIYYLQKEYNMARKLCMTHLKTSKNYEYWVAKGLVLLSDISLAQNDLFNARAALESLIENYKGQDNEGIIATAKKTLEEIKAKESEDSRIVPE